MTLLIQGRTELNGQWMVLNFFSWQLNFAKNATPQLFIDGGEVVVDWRICDLESGTEILRRVQTEELKSALAVDNDTAYPKGTKYDSNKTPHDLWSPDVLEATADVLGFGANKYEPYNWARGIKYSRVFSALLRHLWAFWRGERLDEETGLHHLAHAMCCLMFLLHYDLNYDEYVTFDDRYGYSE